VNDKFYWSLHIYEKQINLNNKNAEKFAHFKWLI